MSTDTVAFEVSLAEELILLMLDEKTGYLEVAPGWGFSCVMAGTIIADLALRGRIDTDLKRLYLQDSTPTGDELLDVTLRTSQSLRKWKGFTMHSIGLNEMRAGQMRSLASR